MKTLTKILKSAFAGAIAFSALISCKPNYKQGIMQDITFYQSNCAERTIIFDNNQDDKYLKMVDKYCKDFGYGSIDEAYYIGKTGERTELPLTKKEDLDMAQRWYDLIQKYYDKPK